MSSSVIIDGRLTFSLFHGTSSLFLPSILEHGLGAKNPIEQLQVHRTLKYIVDLVESRYRNNEDWNSERWMYEKFLQQASSDRANWQHGQVYLSPSEIKAAQYACSNKYGSEMISETISLLTERLPDVKLSTHEHPIVKIQFAESRPVVIRVDAVPLEFLASECDQSMEKQLKAIERGISDPIFQVVWSQTNFRLIRPLSKEFLRVVEIDRAEDWA